MRLKGKMRKNIFLCFSCLLAFNLNAYSAQDSFLEPSKIDIHNEIKPVENHFSLVNLVDNFLVEQKQDEVVPVNNKPQIREEFILAASKFNQGNALASYSQYDEIINKVDNDLSLFALSKVFYKSGFFSLAKKAEDKIININQFQDNIKDLKKSYLPKVNLSKDDEIKYAKYYSSIYFDNCAKEVVDELNSVRHKNREISKNDYFFYTLAQANFELKKYSDAKDAINKAISINSENINYKMLKIDILLADKKYKDAYNLINKILLNSSNINYTPDLEIKKQVALLNITKDEKEKKYYAAKKSFLEGNFEKTKKECQNILNFDKENDKIISLYAKSELALGNIERANVHFVSSYKIQKNNIDTIVGLGDIKYLYGDYKNASKMYKKAYKQDKTDYEIILKLLNARRQEGKKQKEILKLENLADKMPAKDYLAYYNNAISLAQKNDVLKEDFLKKTLTINPLYENALGELVEMYLKNKQYSLAKSIIDSISFTLEKNYYYYYLEGLYNQVQNQNKDAIKNYKNSLNLNPNFEIANTKLLKLISVEMDEEI